MLVPSVQVAAREIKTTGELRARVACTHCGLDVPAGLIEAGQSEQFCCAGCRTVYSVIQQHGLQKYYSVKQSAGALSRAAKISAREYRECDDPAFHSLYVRDAAHGMKSAELFLPNVHCAACVWLVERLPRVVPGVVEARLDLRKGLANITWQPELVALSDISIGLDHLGYPPLPARSAQARAALRTQDRKQLINLAVAGACAGNVMLLAIALYAGAFSGMDASIHSFMQWVSMGLGLVSLAWPGRVFFISAFKSLRAGVVHLDVPIAIGLAAGGIWSFCSTLAGTGAIYFDSLAVLVFALLAGRWFQQRQQRWAADALELLFVLTPTSARRVTRSIDTEHIEEVAVQSLSLKDIVEVRPGESFPVDGIIVRGQSAVDESLLSGESQPVDINVSSLVAAGTVNLQGVVRAEVLACGENTRVAKLMKLVEDAARRKAPIVRLADRLAGWFTLAMLLLSLLTFVLWSGQGLSSAITHAVALLIVTCPCALGLATPLAMTVAIGRAARTSILIKGADAIQSMAGTGTIFLDKTGTLTEGRMRLAWFDGPSELIPTILAIERNSSHPVALAIASGLSTLTELPSDLSIPALDIARIRQIHGRGIFAEFEERTFTIGSQAFLEECDCRMDSRITDSIAQALAQGLSPVIVAVDRVALAVAAVGDPIRNDARFAIDQLKCLGFKVGILSGDHPQLVAQVASSLGVDSRQAHGGVSPEMKLQMVREHHAEDSVIMVGDGANDAAALAAATVGIAVKGGVEASLAAADVYLGEPGLSGIVELVAASRRTMWVIRRNLCVSLLYNALAATLAIVGVINPLLAAVLMPISSLSVVTLSFRSRTFVNHVNPREESSVRQAAVTASENPSPIRPPEVLACR
ncbi:MAG TPA: heavy metal translocating P-type ATPase [Phycisphaerales bacterium]|nr:heavy metal translocating P-type ATPase [Phycisphaerales bacterium]